MITHQTSTKLKASNTTVDNADGLFAHSQEMIIAMQAILGKIRQQKSQNDCRWQEFTCQAQELTTGAVDLAKEINEFEGTVTSTLAQIDRQIKQAEESLLDHHKQQQLLPARLHREAHQQIASYQDEWQSLRQQVREINAEMGELGSAESDNRNKLAMIELATQNLLQLANKIAEVIVARQRHCQKRLMDIQARLSHAEQLGQEMVRHRGKLALVLIDWPNLATTIRRSLGRELNRHVFFHYLQHRYCHFQVVPRLFLFRGFNDQWQERRFHRIGYEVVPTDSNVDLALHHNGKSFLRQHANELGQLVIVSCDGSYLGLAIDAQRDYALPVEVLCPKTQLLNRHLRESVASVAEIDLEYMVENVPLAQKAINARMN